MEFPTVEDAKAWYNSPGYQAAIPHRKKARIIERCLFRVVDVHGLQAADRPRGGRRVAKRL
jgi:uncharacterized protein (DUF1330 family)